MGQNPMSANHVFIIEDDKYMQHVLNFCLSEKYRTSVYNDGMAAMGALQSGEFPDVIIADLNTPHLNGLQLVSQLKSSGCFSSIPVIIVSGDQSSEKRIQCLSAGADDYILKPFNPKELDIRVNIVLKRAGYMYSLKHA